jgi:hypothetical protein
MILVTASCPLIIGLAALESGQTDGLCWIGAVDPQVYVLAEPSDLVKLMLSTQLSPEVFTIMDTPLQ